jgi:hypothetical protein
MAASLGLTQSDAKTFDFTRSGEISKPELTTILRRNARD